MPEKPTFCPYCGKPINNEGDFCSYCGKRLSATPPTPPAMQPSSPVPGERQNSPNNKNLLIALLAIGGVIIVLLIILVIHSSSSQSGESTNATDTPSYMEVTSPTDTPMTPADDSGQDLQPTEIEQDTLPTPVPTESLAQELTITDVKCSPNPVGYTEVSGKVTNNSSSPLTTVWIVARVLDQNGNVLSISAGMTDDVTIQPNNTSAFDVWVNGIYNNSTCSAVVRDADVDSGN